MAGKEERMERNIVLYIAVSLDGYIAKSNGDVAWLGGNGDEPDADYGYDAFYETIDTVVMGRTTYEQLVNELSPDVWMYEGKKCYVATTKKRPANDHAEFLSGDVASFVNNLKQQPGKDIWLVGGGKLIDQFIKQDLIDRYIITVIPTILGSGIPLYFSENPEIKLRLIGTKTTDGMVELTYRRR